MNSDTCENILLTIQNSILNSFEKNKLTIEQRITLIKRKYGSLDKYSELFTDSNESVGLDKCLKEPEPPRPKTDSGRRYSVTTNNDVKFSISINPNVRYSISANRKEGDFKHNQPTSTSQPDYETQIKELEERFKLTSVSADTLPFAQRVVAIVRERFNHNAVEFYTAAKIDRRLYSKIISDVSYHPSKETALQMALAAKLSLDETITFLQSAGYYLSTAIKEDIVYMECIKLGIYSVDIVKRLVEKHAK